MARYELTDAQYKMIAPVLSGKAGDVGRSGEDNRLFVNGVVWILRSGVPWRDLPERYGKWDTVYQRFNRWSKKGVWERVFQALSTEADMDWIMLDSKAVRAQRQAAESGE